MDDIIYDVMIGIVILTLVIVVLNVTTNGVGTLRKGTDIRANQENAAYDLNKFDDYKKLANDASKLNGSDVISFIRYQASNKDITSIDVEKYSSTASVIYISYKEDGTQAKIDDIVNYISGNSDSKKENLLSSKYTITYNEVDKKVVFTLDNNHN